MTPAMTPAHAAPETVPIASPAKRLAYRPANRFAACLMWPLWPILDQHTGRPSGPKCMAWAIYGATVAGHPLAAAVTALLLATMFGYSMFKDALAKATMTMATNDSVNVSAKFSKTITELRGATGEALRSLADRVGAKTPSGDD